MTDAWAAFVSARVAELAEADWHIFDCSGRPREDGHCCEVGRWLARDVKAMRAILAHHTEVQTWSWPPADGDEAVQEALSIVVRSLAAIWSDHPDYPGAHSDPPLGGVDVADHAD